MPDDHHPLMPRRNPEDIDLGAIKADLEFLIEQVNAVPQGASPQAALHDARERCDRHRLDRAFLAALPLTYANLLEPHDGRLAIRRFHCHAVTSVTTRMALAALVCCIPMMTSLNVASASEHRSRAVTREFQREHPCPSTGRTSGACPGYRKDHVVPLVCGGPDAVSNLQWQTISDARAKDTWERRACAR
jgi:hypothetical protein